MIEFGQPLLRPLCVLLLSLGQELLVASYGGQVTFHFRSCQYLVFIVMSQLTYVHGVVRPLGTVPSVGSGEGHRLLVVAQQLVLV